MTIRGQAISTRTLKISGREEDELSRQEEVKLPGQEEKKLPGQWDAGTFLNKKKIIARTRRHKEAEQELTNLVFRSVIYPFSKLLLVQN